MIQNAVNRISYDGNGIATEFAYPFTIITISDIKVMIVDTDGTETVNYGNYGVIYQLRLPTANSGGVALYLSPQGGEYAGFLGVRYQKPAELVLPTPMGQTAFGSVGDFRQISLVGRYVSGQDLFVRFSPPGGSNLPVRLVLSPYWRSGGA